jgi:DNA-binding IclR family transcriptional regulator
MEGQPATNERSNIDRGANHSTNSSSLNERWLTLVLVDLPVSVVARVAALLRTLSASEPHGATTAAAARGSGLARPTAHRLLTVLAEQGLVDRAASGVWMLGPELFLLGSSASPRYDVTALAQPVVRQLAVTTEESAFYSTRRGDETVCLIREDGSFPLRSHVLYEGIRFPLGVASAGLAILAFLPDRDVADFLDRTDLTATYGSTHAGDALLERLEETRANGYAVNGGLIVEGSWGMAAAVFDANANPIGALSLTGVEHRFSPDRRPRLGKLLRQAAYHLTQSLSRNP